MGDRPFIIPLFIPHMGCPQRCVFCNQASITGGNQQAPSPVQVRRMIKEYLGLKRDDRGPVEVAFYGGNFLGLAASYRQSLLGEAQEFVNKGEVESIRFSTRPDTITSAALHSIAPYDVGAVEVGAQSMDDTVLDLSCRGHSAKDTARAAGILRSHELIVGLQIMPGLPGDTRESILETGRRVIELKPDFVRIYPAVVIKNTVLARWYDSGRFEPLSLGEAVEVAKRLYLLFEGQGISVIRMGLHASGSLLQPGNVVAGPFHPAFGHLVHSAVFFDLMVQALEAQRGLSKRVAFKVHPDDVPKAMGHRRGNITGAVERFNLEELRVLPDQEASKNTVRIEDLNGLADVD